MGCGMPLIWLPRASSIAPDPQSARLRSACQQRSLYYTLLHNTETTGWKGPQAVVVVVDGHLGVWSRISAVASHITAIALASWGSHRTPDISSEEECVSNHELLVDTASTLGLRHIRDMGEQ